MLSHNKRGISPLVATVIIIAITVAAGITLFSVVFPILSPGITTCTQVTFTLDPASCVDVREYESDDRNTVYASIDRTKSTSDEPSVLNWNIVLDGGAGERRNMDVSGFTVDPGQQSTTPGILVSDNPLDNSLVTLSDLGIKLFSEGGVANKNRIHRISVYPTIEIRGAEFTCEKVQQTIERLRMCIGVRGGSSPNICSDGTPYNQCSATQPSFCEDGTLFDRCGAPESCGCPAGLTCQPDGSCEIAPTTCSDGTPINTCVPNQPPAWCNGDGEIVGNCQECPCPPLMPPFICNEVTITCDSPIGEGEGGDP